MAFIGRERELVRLAAALQQAAEGTSTRVAIRGPAGIGISGLIDELERRLASVPGVAIARARAYESAAGIPFFGLAQAVHRLLARAEDAELPGIVGSAGHDLAALLPLLRQRFEALRISTQEPRLVAPEQRASRLIESVLGALDRCAADGLVLLVLEDLHWSDPGTRVFVEELVRLRRRLRICLMVTYDPDQLHRRHPAWPLVLTLEGSPFVEVLTLGPLDREELARFAQDLTGEPPSGGLVAALLEGSRGNPMLASQLLAAQASIEGIRLSEPFDAIVQARLAALSPAAARCLHVLAAARRPVDRLALLQLTFSDGHLSPAGLTEAVSSGLAVTPLDQDGSELVGIRHALVTEAVERLISPPERQAIHRALATDLADTPAERAWHWDMAMAFAEAREAHLEAGRAAEEIEPGGTALVHYERALELRDVRDGASGGAPGGDPVDAAELLGRAAEAASSAGLFRRAGALAQQAVALRSGRGATAAAATEGPAGTRALRLAVGALHERLGRYRWAAGDLRLALESFERALELIPDESTAERARALATYAQHLMIDGRFDDSARVAERARAVARATTPVAVAEAGHATCTLAVDVAYDGRLERGLELLEEATALALEAGRLDDLMRAFANRTTLLDLDSRRAEALAVVKEGIDQARRAGLEGVYGSFLRGNAADILYMLGRWRESEAECRAALEWQPAGVAFFSPTLYLSLLLAESRADEEASRLVGQTLLELESVPAGQWRAIVQRAAVSLALWRGDMIDALRVAAREWERVLETDDPAQVAMAASTTLEACAAASEDARARRDWATVATSGELAGGVLRVAEVRVAGSDLPSTLGARREAELHMETARAHQVRRRGHSDPDVWARIAAAWQARGVPYFAAKARWWEALAALQARDQRTRARAREALREAWDLAAKLPARPLMRELVELSRRGRIALPEADVLDAVTGRDPDRDGDAALRVLDAAAAKAVDAPLDDRRPETRPLADRVPLGPGAARARGELLDHPGGEEIMARAGTATGRAIGERLVARPDEGRRDSFGLSPRETGVLNVLVEGRTNREIAERLFISERTVGVHVRKILSKLGVAGRVEAASLAIRLGLVPEMPVESRGRRRG